MICAEKFLDDAFRMGFNTYTGVPCSYLKPLINASIQSDHLSYIPAANEGDAVGIAAGVYLGGGMPVVMFQNSGLGNAVNPFTSLIQTFEIPILMIATLRGDPENETDEPQHQLMGKITTQLLDLMEVSWSWFPRNENELIKTMEMVKDRIVDSQRPHVLVMKKDSVEPYDLTNQFERKSDQVFSIDDPKGDTSELFSRKQVMELIIENTNVEDDLIIATTGYSGRELYAAGDRKNHFYMVGSMGCAIDIGLGLALMQPNKRVIVIDGDGAILMRLGAMSTVGFMAPENLIHIVLDNGTYESTGSQRTVSSILDFRMFAHSNSYRNSTKTNSLEDLSGFLNAKQKGPSFIHFPIASGVPRELPRPSVSPNEVLQRFRRNIK
jgi:phosphonopyruvate decarboxylase